MGTWVLINAPWYYIVTGSLRLGTEELGPGDGFVVPSGGPYTYSAGPEGVEVLEFRTAETFDIRMASTQPTYCTRLPVKLSRARPRWAGEPRPQRKVAD